MHFEERNDGARARKIGRWLGQVRALSPRFYSIIPPFQVSAIQDTQPIFSRALGLKLELARLQNAKVNLTQSIFC